MKTLISIFSELLSETFEKTDPAAWKESPAYRPGPVMIPVETTRPTLPPGRNRTRRTMLNL